MKPFLELSMDEQLAEAARRKKLRELGRSLADDGEPTPPRPEARELARRPCQFCKGTLGPLEEVCPACLREPLEKSEQAEVVKLYRAYGCKVYNLSQARASKQTPGLPDLWVVRFHEAWWHECKRPVSGRPSTPQAEFELECTASQTGYVRGGLAVARGRLVRIGAARRTEDGDIEPIPR